MLCDVFQSKIIIMLPVVQKKLQTLYQRYQVLEKKLLDNKIIANLDFYTEVRKEWKKIAPLAKLYAKWQKKAEEIKQWKTLLVKEDNDSKENIYLLLQDLNKELVSLEREILTLQKQNQTTNSAHTIIEIRGAAGGREAKMFAKELFDMYINFIREKKWKYELLSQVNTSDGGYSFVSFLIKSSQAFSLLCWEAGVHRVQRIPKTESMGRIHTSTATVAVLVEKTATDVPLAAKDLKFDTFRSSGAGGQHVNTTDSAVRVTHLPSGLVVSCQEGRSQHDNKDKALKLLRARLFKIYQEKREAANVSARNKQIGEGDRSEKIRTYNFPQNRVTDHRINLTIKNIEHIMSGKLQPLLTKLMVLNLKEYQQN